MHKIVFSGKILSGHDPAKVRDKLLSMLGVGPEQAERLFSGKPLTVKKGLSAEEAQRYVEHLNRRGIGVEVDPPLPPAGSSPFPTLIFDDEPEEPVEQPQSPPPQVFVQAVAEPPAAFSSSTAGPRAKPIPAPKMKWPEPAIGTRSAAAPVSRPAGQPSPRPAMAENPGRDPAASPVNAIGEALGDQVTCPQCGEVQPKRTLCRACAIDMPRFAAAREAAAIEKCKIRVEESQSALSNKRFSAVSHNGNTCHVAPHIKPFWERLPKFFLFPLQGGNWVALFLLSFASLLAFFLPVPFPFDHILAQCLIILTGVRRAFIKMDAISRGYLTDDDQTMMSKDPQRANLPWKLLGVMIVWGIVVNITGSISEVLGYLVWAFTVVTLPATIMALSVTNSFVSGLNPVLWIKIIRGVGKSYAALFVFLALLSGGSNAVLPLLGPLLKGWLFLPVVDFCFLYFLYVMFAMMGYVLYQYHWELGVHVERLHDEGVAAPVDAIGDVIAERIASGDVEAALEAAREQHQSAPEDIKVQERYHKLLLMAGKTDHVLEHGRRYLSLLLQKKQLDQAMTLHRRLLEVEPGFKPVSPDEILKLAQEAHRCRQFEMAFSLIEGFEQKFQNHVDIPQVRFLAARIQSEAFRRDDLAKQTLQALCEQFPKHEVVVSEAVPYLKALQAIAQGAPS